MICGVTIFFSNYFSFVYVFIGFMVFAFICATQIKFKVSSSCLGYIFHPMCLSVLNKDIDNAESYKSKFAKLAVNDLHQNISLELEFEGTLLSIYRRRRHQRHQRHHHHHHHNCKLLTSTLFSIAGVIGSTSL